MTTLSHPTKAKIKAQNFRLQPVQAFNALRGGHHQTAELGEPLWVCDLETTPLGREQGGSWKWLLAKLRGMARRLYLYDASRARPLSYLQVADH